MPIHKVRGPDGQIHQFKFDEGVTPDEVMQYANDYFSQQSEPEMAKPEAPEREKEAWYEDFGEGVGSSLLDTYYGVKDLIPGVDLDEEDRARMRDWKEDAAQSKWGTAGRVVGEIGQLAVPGSAGLKAAKVLREAGRLGRTARALPLGADVAGSAGLSAIQLPDEGATRGQEAFQGGAAALAGGAAAKALAPLFRGVRGSPSTEALRDAGAKLTPGQMKGGFLQGLENYGEYLVPSLSKAIQKNKKVADESLEMVTLRDINVPDPSTILSRNVEDFVPTKSGWEGVSQVQKAFEEGYEKAWGTGNVISAKTIPVIEDIYQKGIKGLGKKDRRALKTVMDDVKSTIGEKPNLSPKELDEVLRNYVTGKPKKYRLDNVVKDMRSTLRGGLDPENIKALNDLDRAWPKMAAMENAVGTAGAALKMGQLNPQNLMTGAKRGSNRSTFARGDAPFQRRAAEWKALQGEPPGMLMTEARRLVTMIPNLPGLRKLGDQLAGTNPSQAQLRKWLQEEMAQNLRKGISTARLSGAYEGDN